MSELEMHTLPDREALADIMFRAMIGVNYSTRLRVADAILARADVVWFA